MFQSLLLHSISDIDRVHGGIISWHRTASVFCPPAERSAETFHLASLISSELIGFFFPRLQGETGERRKQSVFNLCGTVSDTSVLRPEESSVKRAKT